MALYQIDDELTNTSLILHTIHTTIVVVINFKVVEKSL